MCMQARPRSVHRWCQARLPPINVCGVRCGWVPSVSADLRRNRLMHVHPSLGASLPGLAARRACAAGRGGGRGHARTIVPGFPCGVTEKPILIAWVAPFPVKNILNRTWSKIRTHKQRIWVRLSLACRRFPALPLRVDSVPRGGLWLCYPKRTAGNRQADSEPCHAPLHPLAGVVDRCLASRPVARFVRAMGRGAGRVDRVRVVGSSYNKI